mmetsp:Transcript_85908/g.243642  ORF Transcript_85908/g.243642 Transcript_85908/m.243642 type:complete len:131 (-) Transcript_85908:118-510(-)
MNLLVGLTGSGSSGGPKEIEAMVSAIRDACCSGEGAEIFSVRTPIDESSGNQVYGFLRAGRGEDAAALPLKEALGESGRAVSEGFPADALGERVRFGFERRVTFAFNEWSPSPAEAGGAGGGGGGFSLFG